MTLNRATYVIKIDVIKLSVLFIRILCQHRVDGMIVCAHLNPKNFQRRKTYCRGGLRTTFYRKTLAIFMALFMALIFELHIVFSKVSLLVCLRVGPILSATSVFY